MRVRPDWKLALEWEPWFFVLTLLFRVATFNDCDEASQELQKQIGEARYSLHSKSCTLTLLIDVYC